MTFDNNPNNSADNKSGGYSLIHDIYDWAQSIIFSLVFIVLLFTFVFRIVGVSGVSMEDTLNDGAVSESQIIDHLLITSLNYTPRRGDIVVLTTKAVDQPIIKRVIAVAGQTVNIDFKKYIVYVDGKALDEPYAKVPFDKSMFSMVSGDMKFPVKVPEGHVFVMGDNRNDSHDSRFSDIGFVDTRDIMGKAFLRIYPLNKIGLI